MKKSILLLLILLAVIGSLYYLYPDSVNNYINSALNNNQTTEDYRNQETTTDTQNTYTTSTSSDSNSNLEGLNLSQIIYQIANGAKNIHLSANLDTSSGNDSFTFSLTWYYQGEVFYMDYGSRHTLGSSVYYGGITAPSTIVGFYNETLNTIYVIKTPVEELLKYMATNHLQQSDLTRYPQLYNAYVLPNNVKPIAAQLIEYYTLNALLVLEDNGDLILLPVDMSPNKYLVPNTSLLEINFLDNFTDDLYPVNYYILAQNIENFTYIPPGYLFYWNTTTFTTAKINETDLYNMIVEPLDFQPVLGTRSYDLYPDQGLLVEDVYPAENGFLVYVLETTNNLLYVGSPVNTTLQSIYDIDVFGSLDSNVISSTTPINTELYSDPYGVITLLENGTVRINHEFTYYLENATLEYYIGEIVFDHPLNNPSLLISGLNAFPLDNASIAIIDQTGKHIYVYNLSLPDYDENTNRYWANAELVKEITTTFPVSRLCYIFGSTNSETLYQLGIPQTSVITYSYSYTSNDGTFINIIIEPIYDNS